MNDGKGDMRPATPKLPQNKATSKDQRGRRRRHKPDRPKDSEGQKKSEPAPQTQQLLEIALEQEVFHTPDGRAFAAVRDRGHRETWLLDSEDFKAWLRVQFRRQQNRVANRTVLDNVLSQLKAEAFRREPPQDVFVRIGAFDGKVYLDLGDRERRIVEIDGNGWRITETAPVPFHRPKGLKPLPKPKRGGSIKNLKRFLNVDDGSFVLVIVFLLSPFMPVGARPILILVGEAGSAKTTTVRVIRALIDPNVSGARVLPKKEKDLVIAAQNSVILAYDNVSELTDALSDAFCRIATKSGLGERTLYTNLDETLVEVQASVILNGIEYFARKGDLLDRSILLDLKPVKQTERKEEAVFWREFEAAAPRLLGALLDGVAHALANVESMKLDRLPRMADFAKWSAAAVGAFGWTPEMFLNTYRANIESSDQIALEADPLARALLRFMDAQESWKGTAEDLLGELRAAAGHRSRELPAAGNALSGKLKRIGPNLRRIGLQVDFGRTRQRFIEITRVDVDDPEKKIVVG